jgi:LysR family cyn operon transcriptional activator
MDLRPLRYFIAVAECQHMTQAAERLHITQSTLSHSIQQLEAELKVPLFDRVGRGIRLTQAGELFLGFARRAMKEVEDGMAAIVELENVVAGRLRVGVIPSINSSVMSRAVARFAKAYPRVQLTVEEMGAIGIEDGLLQGRLDLAVALSPATSPELVVESLFEERLVLFVNRASPFAGQASVRASSLAQIRLALLPDIFATRRLIDANYGAYIDRNAVIEMNSVNALLTTAMSGDVATILNERALTPEKDLVKVPITHPSAMRTTALVWSKARYRTPAARRFAEIFMEIL